MPMFLRCWLGELNYIYCYSGVLKLAIAFKRNQEFSPIHVSHAPVCISGTDAVVSRQAMNIKQWQSGYHPESAVSGMVLLHQKQEASANI